MTEDSTWETKKFQQTLQSAQAIIHFLLRIFLMTYIVQLGRSHKKRLSVLTMVRQTTQNNVSILFLTDSVEERTNTYIDISENKMEYFLKNLNYAIVF